MRWKHPVLTALAIAVVVIVVAVGGSLLWAQSQINPGGHQGPVVSVSIPNGSSTARIASLLSSHGVIRSPTLFTWYVHLHSDGPFQPGLYQMPKNSSYQSAIDALQNGPKIVTDTLVIPEGFTIMDIAARVAALPNMGLSVQGFLQAANSGGLRSPYEPAGVNDLEGLLFPATYQVRQGETEVDILSEMVAAFNARAQELNLPAVAAARHETVYQLVTVASIIEKEAKLSADRGPVASVVYNRLRTGVPLGADSTQTYYLRQTDPTLVPTVAQYNQPSPYNTRLKPGLPPTPISNPGIPSLQAAANPPSTAYLYFVEINPDGQLGFASDNAGFTALQQKCRAAQLC
jgi:UPF0755 protein